MYSESEKKERKLGQPSRGKLMRGKKKEKKNAFCAFKSKQGSALVEDLQERSGSRESNQGVQG